MDEIDDLHYCLSCHMTVTGLDNYIKHKKHDCPAKRSKQSNKSTKVTGTCHVPFSTNEDYNNLSSQISSEINITTQSENISLKGKIIPINSKPIEIVEESVVISDTVTVLSSQSSVGALSYNSFENTRQVLSPGRYSLDIFQDEKSHKTIPYNFTGQPSGLLSPGLVVSSHASVDPNLVIDEGKVPDVSDCNESKDKSESVEKDEENQSMPDAASVAEFFASLELRIRQPEDRVQNEVQTHNTSDQLNDSNVQNSNEHSSPKEDAFEERLKNIKIANILTDLNFSSDSEGLPSDVDELLNFSDEDDEFRTGGKWKPGNDNPPSNHTKGKWRPGSKLTSYGKHSKGGKLGGKWRPGMVSTPLSGGKWKSGQRVPHGQGKHGKLKAYKEHRGLTDSEDDEKIENITSERKGRLKDKKPPPDTYCSVCRKKFRSPYYLSLHMNTSYHKKRLVNDNSAKKDIKCIICGKIMSTKDNYAKHLISIHGIDGKDDNRFQNVDGLDSSVQQLVLNQKGYQCRVCMFFTDDSNEFSSHMISDVHTKNCNLIFGNLYCKRCQIHTGNNKEMVKHLKSSSHKENIETSSRPCIVKESRTNVNCKICDKTVSSIKKLSEHMKSAHLGSNKPLRRRGVINRPSCQYCEQKCRSEAILAIHVRRKHTGEKPFSCTTCMIGFVTNTDLKRHFESSKHLETAVQLGTKRQSIDIDVIDKDNENIIASKQIKKSILCKFKGCTYSCTFKKDILTHYKEIHGNDKRFVCDLCGYAVNHKSHYDKHCLTKRHLDLVKASENAKSGIEGKENVQNSFHCKTCNLKFADEINFHKHKIAHIVTTEKDLYEKTNGDVLQHIDKKYHEFIKALPKNADEEVTCPENNCGKMYKRNLIIAHLRSHTNYKPFSCVYCEKSFHRGERLRAHLFTHFPCKWHNCDHCESKFKSCISLKQHILSNHPNNIDFEAAFICSTCGYKCMTSTLLKVHSFSHLDEEEKKYRCPWQGCSKYFQFKSAMNSHIRRHTKEKPYLCDQCGFSAIDRQHLNRHKRKHTGIRNYKCEYCTYSYYNASGLRRHMRVHINVRPFKCPYCNFSANSLEHIRKHVNFNSKHVSKGEFLYPCSYCVVGYKTQGELKQHLCNDHNLEVTNKDTHISTLHPNLVSETAKLKYVPAGQKINPVEEKYVAKKWQRKPTFCDENDGNKIVEENHS